MWVRVTLAVFVLAVVASNAAGAQAPSWYWCDPLRAYYPYVATCPVPWRPVPPNPYAQPSLPTPTGQTPPLSSPPSATPPAEETASYRQGLADWQSLQVWFGSQSGDRRAGADYWAGNRSKVGHKSCEEAADGFSGNKADFIAGCQDAKRHLDPIDVKRKSDSEYRAGFNDGAARLPLDTAPRQDVPAATISDDYRRMLRAWLDDHEYYPEAARQRGEQGRVGLRFRVDRSGRLLDHTIVSSSGYPDLDAAVDGMMKGAILPPFPAGMTEPEIDVSVNIGFGLQADAATPTPAQSAPLSDPLLDAVHKKLLKTALDVCARAAGGVPLATEECFNNLPKGVKSADIPKDCPELLAKTNASLCPDGPEKLVAKWEANRLADTVSFRDFVLDKGQMSQPDEWGAGKAIVIRGVYIRASDTMDYLLAPGKMNPMAYGRSMTFDVAIPLLLDEADSTSRAARSALLSCREKYPPETFAGCSVMAVGFVQKCTITMQLTNASHEAVCIKVNDVTVDPRN